MTSLPDSVGAATQAERASETSKNTATDGGIFTPYILIGPAGLKAETVAAGNQVIHILDEDIPKLNKAHDLGAAEKKYLHAIEVAGALPAAEMDRAGKALESARREEKNLHGPAPTELVSREAALNGIIHLKETAQGNMALWYYRQGRIQEGNEKVLESCGFDARQAHALRAMSPADREDLARAMTVPRGNLADAHFQRHLEELRRQGIAVPDFLHGQNKAELPSPPAKAPVSKPAEHAPPAAKPEAKPEVKPEAKAPEHASPSAKPEAKPATKPESKPESKPAEHAPAAAGENKFAALTNADLVARLEQTQKMGYSGLPASKELFQEAIRRAEDPALTARLAERLKANLDALDQGKNSSGQPLDGAARTDLHQQNVQMASYLGLSAQLHSQYANYLGDGRFNSDNAPPVRDEKGVNQLRSMDREQRLAIAAADRVDLGLLKRVDASIQRDITAGAGDSAQLNRFKILMRGDTSPSGSGEIGLLNQRVFLRDQLAELYLREGKLLNNDGSPKQGTGNPGINELFRPQEALDLVKQAQVKYLEIYGPGAHDLLGARLFARGSEIHPEVFRNKSREAMRDGASAGAGAFAMAGSLMSSTVVRYGLTLAGEALTEGRLNPTLLNGAANASALAAGVVTHRLAYKAMTGESEKWSDSIIYGGTAAAAPIVYKSAFNALQESPAWSSRLNWRLEGITGKTVLARTAQDMGGDPTFTQMAGVFRRSGLTEQATHLEALGGKTLSSASAEELSALDKALNLNSEKGRQALGKLIPEAGRDLEAEAARGRLGRAIDRVKEIPSSTVSKAKALAWENRFYNLKPAPVVEEGASTPSLWSRVTVFNKVDPMTATEGQIGVASRASRFVTAAAATLPAEAFYVTTNQTYSNWWKGRSYIGSDGQEHKYTFMDAAWQANAGRPDQTLAERVSSSTPAKALGGFLLYGSSFAGEGGHIVPSLLKTSFNSLVYAPVLSGSLSSSGWTKYRQGAADLKTAGEIRDMSGVPLQDYGPESGPESGSTP